MKKGFFFFISFYTIFCYFLFPVDIYVSMGKNGSGTLDSPLGTLWEALFLAEPGDIIHVSEGIYSGLGGLGEFTIDKSNLTLLGGYKTDFSERDPFTHFTILKTSVDIDDLDNDKKSIITVRRNISYIVIDGLFLDGQTRNNYFYEGELDLETSSFASLIESYAENITIKNCILINGEWTAISTVIYGDNNEISNCIILNVVHQGLELYASNPCTMQIKNNLFAFIWQKYAYTGGMAIHIPQKLNAVIDGNIIMYCAGVGIYNVSENTVLKNTLFFICRSGYYRFAKGITDSVYLWEEDDLQKMNLYPELFLLKEGCGNITRDPQLVIEPDFVNNFVNLLLQEPDKLNMEMIQDWRYSHGFTLFPELESENPIYGMVFNLKKVIPDLIIDNHEYGVQPID